MTHREPQPIVLPQLKQKRLVLAGSTVCRHSAPTVSVRLRCGACNSVVALESGDCFCGQCGTRLRG